MRLKSNVKITGIRPEILLALTIANDVYKKHGHNLVVTSLLDGVHSKNSLHYAGCAADLRTMAAHIPKSTIAAISEEIRRALTSDFDLVVEPDHLHLEFQPARPLLHG